MLTAQPLMYMAACVVAICLVKAAKPHCTQADDTFDFAKAQLLLWWCADGDR